MNLNWRIIKSNKESREEIRKSQRSKFSSEKECIYCHEKFDYGYSSLKSCLACKIIVKCCICNKDFQLNLNKYSGTHQARINEAILNKQNLYLTCSEECKRKLQGRTYSQYCKENPEKIKNQFKSTFDPITGHYFRGNNDLTLRAQIMREKCKEIEENNPNIRKEHRTKCIKKAREYWENNPELIKQNAVNNISKWNNSEKGKNFSIKHCKSLGKEFQNYSHKNINCNINCNKFDFCNFKNDKTILKNIWGYCILSCSKPNFIIRNNVKYYKNKQLDKLCKDILNKDEDINKYPGFNIKLGRVFYKNIDVLTDEKILNYGSNFTIHNGVEFILNHSTNEYEPLEEFYSFYKNKIDYEDIDTEINKFLNLGFVLEPIIKINDENWNREQTDEYLCKNGYKWICYIKLFQGKPLIVGKTGTRMVSNSPIDFNFKVYNENDFKDPCYSGQGRRFVKKFYPNIKYTDFDKILIKNFNEEQEALNCEKFIVKQFNLFES